MLHYTAVFYFIFQSAQPMTYVSSNISRKSGIIYAERSGTYIYFLKSLFQQLQTYKHVF